METMKRKTRGIAILVALTTALVAAVCYKVGIVQGLAAIGFSLVVTFLFVTGVLWACNVSLRDLLEVREE